MTDWRVEVNGQTYAVRVRYSRRRTIALHLEPGPRLQVRAPRSCPEWVVREFLDGRRAWIARHLEELPPPVPVPRFVDGERHHYLGAPLALRIAAGRRRLHRVGRELKASLPDPSRRDLLERLVREWYTDRAEWVFHRRLSLWCRRLHHWRLPPAELRLRRMTRRWGSCSTRGRITLNTRLVERSPALIDLVLVHELCHLLEFRHSPRFYGLMEAAMPDWRSRADALDRGRVRIAPGAASNRPP